MLILSGKIHGNSEILATFSGFSGRTCILSTKNVSSARIAHRSISRQPLSIVELTLCIASTSLPPVLSPSLVAHPYISRRTTATPSSASSYYHCHHHQYQYYQQEFLKTQQYYRVTDIRGRVEEDSQEVLRIRRNGFDASRCVGMAVRASLSRIPRWWNRLSQSIELVITSFLPMLMDSFISWGWYKFIHYASSILNTVVSFRRRIMHSQHICQAGISQMTCKCTILQIMDCDHPIY